MYGDTDNLDKTKAKLDAISPSFCMAKWMHSTVHLLSGRTHSCYLPPTHAIPLEEVQANPSALHNTSYKKEQRRLMLKGERPAECSMCWAIEDLSPPGVSDRIFRGADSWTEPYFDKVSDLPWDRDIEPSYLEVSFSSLCNFMCSYCSPHVSTRWLEEVRREGPYQLSTGEHQNLKALSDQGLMPIDEDGNPYIEAFWKWWPQLVGSLKIFRITGGEPLLSKHTFRVLDWIEANSATDLALEINSNFGVPRAVFDRFLDQVTRIRQAGKVRDFCMHVSIDTFGKQAEYIRHGLDFAEFDRNVRKYLTQVPTGGLAFMSTFNALSVSDYRRFLQWVADLRAEFNNPGRAVLLDIAHLSGPSHQSIRILTPEYQDQVGELIHFVERDMARGPNKSFFRRGEIIKLQRIFDWMRVPQDPIALAQWRIDFYMFFSEHDRRRKTNFLATFPEMEEFWAFCRNLAEGSRMRSAESQLGT